MFLGITAGTGLPALQHPQHPPHKPSSKGTAPAALPAAPIRRDAARRIPAPARRAVRTPGIKEHPCYQEMLSHILQHCLCHIKLILRRWLRDAFPRGAAPCQAAEIHFPSPDIQEAVLGWAVLGRGSRAGMSQGSSGVTQAQIAPHRPHSPIPSCISSDSQQGFLRYPEFHIICHSRHIPR